MFQSKSRLNESVIKGDFYVYKLYIKYLFLIIFKFFFTDFFIIDKVAFN